MFNIALYSLLFCASAQQKDTISISCDSVKLSYYRSVLNPPNRADTYIRFRMTDGNGRYWVEMIHWGDVKKRFYPVVDGDHQSFVILVSNYLLKDTPVTQTAEFGNMGLVVRSEYAQIMKDLPHDIFFQTYFDEKGFIKFEYLIFIPEIMEYLFNHQVVFLHDTNTGVKVDRVYWEKMKNKK